MKLAVTGAAGFIGSAACRHMAGALGWDVIAIDALTYAGHMSSLQGVIDNPRFTFIQADICDRAAMADIFARHAPDAILHLAAESHVDRSLETPDAFIRTNVQGTFTLLDVALRYWNVLPSSRKSSFRFHHVSTDEVYGALGESDPPFTEASRYDPRSPYAASKAASDHLVRAWGHSHGLPVLISNCSNNYGPYQLPEKLIPLTILNALAGAPLPVYGTGENRRDWLHVEDHVSALVHILTRGEVGQTYNIGARGERSNIAVVREICRILDRMAPAAAPREDLVRFVADRPGHDFRYAIDATRLEGLGWRARHDFESGLEATVRWYQDNPDWWTPLRAAGHGTARLGLP